MTIFRRFAILSSVVALTVPRMSAAAIGTVDLSWNACSPVVPTVAAGAPGPVTLFLSVTGHDQLHEGYAAFLILRSESPGSLKDAWRFDASGCQGSSLIDIRHLPPGPSSKSCPAFRQGVPGYEFKSYDFDALSGRAQCILVNSYPAGVTAVDPGTRYFLMGVVFDHTFSVVGPGTPGLTCGGFEQDISIDFVRDCIGIGCGLNLPSWFDLQGVEHDFVLGSGRLTFCGSCAVPAENSTWGAIKNAYRR